MKRLNASIIGLGFGAVLTLTGCGGGDDGDTQAFCATMLEFEENDPTAGTEQGTPEFFEATIEAMEEARDVAPAEIRGDLEAMIDSFGLLSELDPTELSAQEFEDLSSDFETIQETSSRIDNYIANNCDN